MRHFLLPCVLLAVLAATLPGASADTAPIDRTTGNLMAEIASIASQFVGQTENPPSPKGGRKIDNEGKIVNFVTSFCGSKRNRGIPWCQCFVDAVTWMVMIQGDNSQNHMKVFNNSPSVLSAWDSAILKVHASPDSRTLNSCGLGPKDVGKGWAFVFRRKNSKGVVIGGHSGVITSDLRPNGDGTYTMETVQGNTLEDGRTEAGSSSPEGVYKRSYRVRLSGSRIIILDDRLAKLGYELVGFHPLVAKWDTPGCPETTSDPFETQRGVTDRVVKAASSVRDWIRERVNGWTGRPAR